jgi:hypothetical protein
MKSIVHILFFILFCPLIAFSQYTLYPPLNLQVEPIECISYLTWEQPQLPGGGVPAGLLGYVIYRNGDSLVYVDNPVTLEYYDIDLSHCSLSWDYYVTAHYDLGSYGSPGQTGDSDPSNIVSIGIMCDYGIFPSCESWDQGTFEYKGWEFIPDQGNWSIDIGNGNPAPTAVFTGTPALNNYNHSFYRGNYDGDVLSGFFDLWLDFDLKLENINNTGSELFSVLTSMCYTQGAFLMGVYNIESFDWTQYHISLNPMIGSNFFLYFTASGPNSANFQRWMIDNICVNPVAHSPGKPFAEVINGHVQLNWSMPVCDDPDPTPEQMPKYNIYRSDTLGNPPYVKINDAYVEDSAYTDLITDPNPVTYRYYVTACYFFPADMFFAESAPSDTLDVYLLSTNNHLPASIEISPNPSGGLFRIGIPPGTTSLEVTDIRGKSLLTMDVQGMAGTSIDLDLKDQPGGVYSLTLVGEWGRKSAKLLLE